MTIPPSWRSKELFITLEGIDGCGKTTQARLLYEGLASRFGEDNVIWTKEPGGWPGGEKLREFLLGGSAKHPLSELFIFVADRCEHVERVIKPSLRTGKIIICERYSDSTLAYQSWGRGIPLEKIEELLCWCAFPVPDMTLLLDLPPEKAYDRLSRRGNIDRLEEEGILFLKKVREGFDFLARREAGRIMVLDGERPVEIIAKEIAQKVEVLFPLESKEKRG